MIIHLIIHWNGTFLFVINAIVMEDNAISVAFNANWVLGTLSNS